jgi:DNA-binding protein HU-beta
MAKKRRMSKRARAAALRNLAKARKARKRPRRRAREAAETPRRRRRSGKRKSAKRVRAGKKAARTRKRRRSHSAREDWRGDSAGHARAARKGWRKRKNRRRTKSGSPRRRKRRTSEKQLRAARRNIRKAHAARRSRRASAGHRSRSSSRRAYGAESRRRRRSYRRRGALENPLSGIELFVGGLLGLTGFGIGDFTDRLLATHPLTDKNAKDPSTGQELWADNPPTTGSYAGLYNPTAIASPMDLPRWANAVLVPGTIFVVAHYVKTPTFRSAMQFFAFGYGVRGLGKGIIDLMALISNKYGLGQRLYDGEMRAMALKAAAGDQNAPALALFPRAGLGHAKVGNGLGCACAKCQQQTAAQQAATQRQQAAANPPPGVGWPSLPREPAGGASTSGGAPPPGGGGGGGTATATNPPPPGVTTNLQGVPNTPRRSGLYAPFGGYEH